MSRTVRSHIVSYISYIIRSLTVAVLAGCATTGATFRSGVGDSLLEHPPYYAGASLDVVARDSTRIGHLPIAFQRGASQAPIFDPRDGSGSAMDRLLEEMNGYLDSLDVSVRVVDGRRVSAVAHASTTAPPDVRFGCIPALGIPGNDCAERGDSALGRGRQAMQLSVGRPSAAWTDWMRDVGEATHTARTLLITLEVGQYLLRQKGWRRTKVLELGTEHAVQLPWLTSLETPVAVLQLTGALIDRNGNAIRIGSEGLHARRTALLVSAVGGQQLLSDADVDAVRTARRDDLAGGPLVWRVALRELTSRLTGRTANRAQSERADP